jgi:hypothetical protein
VSEQGLLPAEHRALRELHATTRQLVTHWRRLASRLGGDPAALLTEGASAARKLVGETAERTAGYELHGFPAAQGTGVRLAGLRGAADRLFERNQALRSALLDLQHVVTLLGYLAALADRRGDVALAEWERGWAQRLERFEGRGRAAVAELAQDPEAATAPADTGTLGRAGQRVNYALGALGEYVDHSPIGRAARRRHGSARD